ncbi:sugar phosphate isomerase/epimerase family protein [Bacillus cereus]
MQINYCIDPGTVGHDVPLMKLINLASEHSFQALEFGIHDVEDIINSIGIEALKKYVNDHRIELAQFSCGIGIPSNISISKSGFLSALRKWEKNCEIASSIGCTKGSILVNSLKGNGESEAVKLSVNEVSMRLRKLCEIADKYNIFVNVEITDKDLLLKSKEIFELINKPNMGYIIDTFNLKYLQNPISFLRELPKDIVTWVHIADSKWDSNYGVRLFPFEGELNLQEMIKVILEKNNISHFSLEVYGVSELTESEIIERLEKASASVQRLFLNCK